MTDWVLKKYPEQLSHWKNNTMRQLFKRLATSIKGASLVELALVMPVIMLMIVGSLDMGSMFVRKMEIANAAKAGAQYALVRKPVQGDLTNISSAVTNSLGGSVTPSTQINVELYCMCFSTKQLCTVDCADEDLSAFINITITEDYTTPFFNYDWFMSSFLIAESTTVKLN